MQNVATHSRVPQIIIDLEYTAAQRSRTTKEKFWTPMLQYTIRSWL